jgi:hypothetical protein
MSASQQNDLIEHQPASWLSVWHEFSSKFTEEEKKKSTPSVSKSHGHSRSQ